MKQRKSPRKQGVRVRGGKRPAPKSRAKLARRLDEFHLGAIAEAQAPDDAEWVGEEFMWPMDIWCNCELPCSPRREDLEKYLLFQKIDSRLTPGSIIFDSETRGGVELVGGNEASVITVSSVIDGGDRAGLEDRLALHLQCLLSDDDRLLALDRELAERMGSGRGLEAMRAALDGPLGTRRSRAVCAFAPFWLRSPQHWNPRSGVAILDHLFVNHEVPRWLYAAWDSMEIQRNFKWMCWFILFGQGGSLKRAGRNLGWSIPTGLVGHLFDIAENLAPEEACAVADLRRLGASDHVVTAVSRSEAFLLDPTDYGAKGVLCGPRGFPRSLWLDTIRWLIRHGDELTLEQCHWVLRWAVHEHYEHNRDPNGSFSWRGRRPQPTIANALAYREAISRPLANLTWKSRGWDGQLYSSAGLAWEFKELVSGEALFLEGQALKHCVSIYARRCATGSSTIVSMRLEGEPRLTIEIVPATGLIKQASGRFNRPANHEERLLIDQWHQSVVMPSVQQREANSSTVPERA